MKQHVLGVLGLGEGRSIISAALTSDLWTIGNICDLNESLCQERQKEFQLPCYTTRYETMLEDPLIDTIAIYTPDQYHAQHCLAALRAGKHVICTKPLFDSLQEAAEVQAAAKAADRTIFVGQSSRFFAPMMAQRADYEAGKHGEVYSAEAHYHADHRWFFIKHKDRPRYKPLFGGISHPADLVRWYLGPIEEVFGYGLTTSIGQEAGLCHPDSMHFVLRAKNGKIGRVSGCYSTPPPVGKRDSHITCVLRGTLGASQADYNELRYSTNFGGTETIHDLSDQAPFYFRFEGKSHHAGEFQNYLEYFARCIDEGVTPKPDLEEGVETVAVMLAMELSLQRNTPIKVDEVLAEWC